MSISSGAPPDEEEKVDEADDGSGPPSTENRRRFHDGEGLSFVDLCSGKGFLSTMLAWEFPKAAIHMCDFDTRLELSHLWNLPNVQFHLQDLYSKEAEDTVAAAVSASRRTRGGACIIVGVHLCGELSRRAIQLWRDAGAAALVMSPCCLPRRRRHDVFGYHVKDQAKKMKVPSYQLWCTMLYGLLPLGEAHCNMCVDDEFVSSPYSTFMTACWPKGEVREKKKVNDKNAGGGGGGGHVIVPGRGAGKWRVNRKLGEEATMSSSDAEAVPGEVAGVLISAE